MSASQEGLQCIISAREIGWTYLFQLFYIYLSYFNSLKWLNKNTT